MPPRLIAITSTPISDPLTDDSTSVTSTSFQPEEGADHRQHLEVAATHAFLSRVAVVRLGDRPENAIAQQRPEDRIDDARRQHQADDQPDDDARQCDDVGKQVMLEIDREQRDQRGREDDADDHQRRPAEHPQVQEEHQHRQDLDDGIADADGGARISGSGPEGTPS